MGEMGSLSRRAGVQHAQRLAYPLMPHSPRSVVTIGVFDGVHVGHVAILQRARAIACEAAAASEVVALSFDPHPLSTIAPERAPERLSVFEQRAKWLRGAGADRVAPLVPTRETLNRSPDEFVAWLMREHNPVAIVEGADFHFGKGRVGHADTLVALGKRRGVAVEIVEPVMVDLEDQTLVRASSSLARWLLAHGRVRDAARVLGRRYALAGVVQPGDRRGRNLGFPTANIECDTMIPADGVYAGVALDADGASRLASVSIGVKPTFAGARRTVEAHLLDWDGPLDTYGWRTRVSLVRRLRDQARYDNVAALVAQIRRDCDRVQEIGERSDLLSTPVVSNESCKTGRCATATSGAQL